MKQIKLKAAALLRKWAQSLDKVEYLPKQTFVVYETRQLQRWRIYNKVNTSTLEERVKRLYVRKEGAITWDEARARVYDTLKQETIVDGAADLAKLLSVFEEGSEVSVMCEFYVKANEETNI